MIVLFWPRTRWKWSGLRFVFNSWFSFSFVKVWLADTAADSVLRVGRLVVFVKFQSWWKQNAVLLQDGEGAAWVAQGPDYRLQRAQVCWNLALAFIDIFDLQGGEGEGWDWSEKYEQVDCVNVCVAEGYCGFCAKNMQSYIESRYWCAIIALLLKLDMIKYTMSITYI